MEGDFIAKSKRIANDKNRMNIILFAALYLLYAIGLLYSENFSYGYFDMEVKLSMFIFPVIISTLPSEVLSKDVARKVLLAFVIGVLASLIICYAQALYHYFQFFVLQMKLLECKAKLLRLTVKKSIK